MRNLQILANLMDKNGVTEIPYKFYEDGRYSFARFSYTDVSDLRDLITTSPKYVLIDDVNSQKYYTIDIPKARLNKQSIKPNTLTRDMVRDLILILSKSYKT